MVNGSGHHHIPTYPRVEDHKIMKAERTRRATEQQLQNTTTKRYHDIKNIQALPNVKCKMHEPKETRGLAHA